MHLRSFNIHRVRVGLNICRIPEVRVTVNGQIKKFSCVKCTFRRQHMIREMARLVQQSQRWLGSQSRWSKRDTDGSTEVIKCHWQVQGNGIFVGLFLAWVTNGRLLSGPVLGLAVFKCLWNWRLSRWYPSVIPFLCVSFLMFHMDINLPCELQLGRLVLVTGFILKTHFFKGRAIEVDPW